MKKTIIVLAVMVMIKTELFAQNKGDKLVNFLNDLNTVLNQKQVEQPSQSPSSQPKTTKVWYDTKSTINVSLSNYFPNSAIVAQYLISSPFLKEIETFIENTLSLERPLNIFFVDNEDTKFNAHFDPSCNCIRISYSIIKMNADKVMENFRGMSYPDAVRGVTLQILFHEMGHYLVHNYNLNITGKEENAVDELSVMSMLFFANEKPAYYKATVCGILGWYDKESSISSRSMVDVHAPSRERYYDMLSLYLGSIGDKALTTDFVGEKDYQISRDRFYRSPSEYKKAYNSWTELMARFL